MLGLSRSDKLRFRAPGTGPRFRRTFHLTQFDWDKVADQRVLRCVIVGFDWYRALVPAQYTHFGGNSQATRSIQS